MALVHAGANVHCGTFMSMYTDILHRAFESRSATADPPRCAKRSRNSLLPEQTGYDPIKRATHGLGGQRPGGPGGLRRRPIELARSVGLPCDPSTFEQPVRRRRELDRELAARGVDVRRRGEKRRSGCALNGNFQPENAGGGAALPRWVVPLHNETGPRR